jgi:hypothetical protein
MFLFARYVAIKNELGSFLVAKILKSEFRYNFENM